MSISLHLVQKKGVVNSEEFAISFKYEAIPANTAAEGISQILQNLQYSFFLGGASHLGFTNCANLQFPVPN